MQAQTLSNLKYHETMKQSLCLSVYFLKGLE